MIKIIFEFAIAFLLASQGVETMNDGDFAEKCRRKLDTLMVDIEKEIVREEVANEGDGRMQYVAIVKPKNSDSNYTFTCVNSPNGIVAHMDLSGDS